MEQSPLLSAPVVSPVAGTAPQATVLGPLACAECGGHVDPDEYRMERTTTYPLGSCTAEGQPLCGKHRITRCTHCARLLPRMETHRVILRWHPRVRSVFNLHPHWEEVFARYCPDCAASYRDPQPPEYYVTPFQVVVIAMTIVGVLLLIYALAFDKFG